VPAAQQPDTGPVVRISLQCSFDELHGFYGELADRFYRAAHPEAKGMPAGLQACVVRNVQALHESLVPQEPCFFEARGSKLSVDELRGLPLLGISHERFRSAYPVKELRTPAVQNHQAAIRAVLDVLAKHGVRHTAYDSAKGEEPA
jgi:hypothetical protein